MFSPSGSGHNSRGTTHDLAQYLDDLQTWLDASGTTGKKRDPVIGGLRSAIVDLRALDEELRAAQAEAEAERARYRDLFELAPDGYLTTDSHGKIADANRAAAALLNVPETFILAKPMLVYVAKHDRSIFLSALREMRHLERGEWTFKLCPRDRPDVDVHATVGAVRSWDASLTGLRWMIRDVTEQQRFQDQLTANRHQLRSLAVELSSAEERERRRIATGIHDNVSQRLAMIKLLMGSIREAALPAQAEPLREAASLLDSAIEESRSLTFELSPPVLYELGLSSAIEWLAEKIQRRHGLRIRVKDRLGSVKIPIELRVLLFQAIREVLANSVKHAAAHSAVVTIAHSRSKPPDTVRLSIQDDGRGFQPTELTPDRAGFGLFNLRTRFEQIGGSFNLKSAPGQGTRVTMLAPLDAVILEKSAAGPGLDGRDAHDHQYSNR